MGPSQAFPFRAPAATGPQAAPGPARLLAFFPLALFGAVHWAALLEPSPGRRATVAVAAATASGAALLAVPAIASRRRRSAALGGTVLALLVVAFLAAGVPAALLAPDRWDDLAAGIADGIGAMVGVTVPYRGVDEWVRITIMLGATLLVAAAALVAFWPDRPRTNGSSGAGRVGPFLAGSPLPAAVILGVLYGVPVVQHSPDRPYLDGAVFCLLLGAFLWLERLRGDQVGMAAVALLVAVLAGLLVAPRLDARSPWLDYRRLASSLEASTTARFNWDHQYGPLDWPREGREVLRIRAAQSAYWKASTLDEFDGVRWRHSVRIPPGDQATEIPHGRPHWTQTIRVVVKGLVSREFIAAGTTLGILEPSPRPAYPSGPGTFVTARRHLRRGHSYRARVYVPRPTPVELRAAGESFPAFTYPYLSINLPTDRGSAPVDPLTERPAVGAPLRVRFTPYQLGAGAGRPEVSYPSGAVEAQGERILESSAYARTWRLARALRAQSTSAYDYVLRVRDRVQLNAGYSESPPPSRVPLETFLFDDRIGYCQQFSGAMALLLRMGGIPARVASGFSPGRLDRGRDEYVVRDLDAHSWVEAYFPGIGWVTFDPTPAIAPARSQVGDDAGEGGAESPRTGGRAGDVPGDVVGGGGAPTSDGGGTDWQVVGGVGAAIALLLAAGAVAGVRRGRIPGGALAPELAELQRALHRTGRTPPAPTTLAALEDLLGGSEAARGYLRALRDQRFRGAGGGPTAAQRKALRRELAAGLGLRGRLRAWWALPPRAAR